MDQVKIGKFISKIRKEKNITQKELADKLGVTDKTVSRWENGHYLPDVSLWKDLCEILNISILDLMNGEIKEITKEEMEDSIFNTVKITNKKVRNMKKKTIIILLISLLAIIVTIIISIHVIKHDKKEEFISLQYTTQYASIEKEDGWVCYFVIEDYSNTDDYYRYDCINLKYKTLDDYYGIGNEVDSNGEIFEYRINVPWVDYVWSKKYSNDIRTISEYFANNNLSKNTITIKDLDNLNLETDIDKVEILNLYNKSLMNKITVTGEYVDYIPTQVITSMTINDYSWVFGYHLEHGKIVDVDLNVKYNGTWLDEVEKKNEYQENILSDIKDIKTYIKNYQTFKLTDKYRKDAIYEELIIMLLDIKKNSISD